jgi:uncharacterized protein YciI
MRKIIFGLAVLAITASPLAAAPKVEMPPEIAAHVPSDLRSYFLVFMVTPAVPKAMSPEIFEKHQAYIRDQTEKKIYQMVGPVTDGGRIRGITILAAASADEARAIVADDPAVKAGIFDIEVHSAVFPNLDSLKIGYPPKP